MRLIITLLLTINSFGQLSIVAAGNQTETIGEVFPIMQQNDTIIEISLSIPKYEIEQPKPIIKKLSIFDKIIDVLKRIFNLK